MHNAQQEIIEKIVEREVIKEVRVGISDEEMTAIHQKNEEEKRRVMKQAQEDMKALIDQGARTAQERAELQAALDREAEDRRVLNEQKKALNDKLKVGTVGTIATTTAWFGLIFNVHLTAVGDGGEAAEGRRGHLQGCSAGGAAA